MTEGGNHGGSSYEETDSPALFIGHCWEFILFILWPERSTSGKVSTLLVAYYFVQIIKFLCAFSFIYRYLFRSACTYIYYRNDCCFMWLFFLWVFKLKRSLQCPKRSPMRPSSSNLLPYLSGGSCSNSCSSIGHTDSEEQYRCIASRAFLFSDRWFLFTFHFRCIKIHQDSC